MIDEVIGWFHNYVSYYFTDIVLFLLIGFVFIRCRLIGYVYSAVLVLTLIFISYVGGYAMPQRDIAVVIFLGTVAGGWRYLVQARSSHNAFGFPFFSWSFENLTSYFAGRRYRKVYADEYARERAKQEARGSDSPQNNEAPRSEKTENSQRREEGSHDERAEKRRERFRQSRNPNAEKPSAENPYETLKVSPADSMEDIKKAYRRLVGRFHPDKMPDSIRGDADLEKAFTEKFVKIKKAYEEIEKRRTVS